MSTAKTNTRKKSLFIMTAITAALHAASASASIDYLGSISLGGAGFSDLSGLTGNLEDGNANNAFNGFGSGIAWAGGNRYLLAPDRGPNATSYNPSVDNTTSWINRYHEVDVNVSSNGVGGWNLSSSLVKTTLLSNATPLAGAATANNPNQTYFTGLSTGYDATNSSNSMRFDPEGIRVAKNGNSVFISDEYGPFINEFDRTTGQRIRSIALPPKFAIANPRATETGATGELVNNTSGRVTNKGMEGLAISPDGTKLFGIMQSPLLQDNALDASLKKKGTLVRIVEVDIATNTTKEYVYELDSKSLGISEITAINDHEMVVIERDGNSGASGVKLLKKIDLTGATDVSAIASLPATSAGLVGVTKVGKSSFLSLAPIFGASTPEKIEGVVFGQTLEDGRTLMLVTNDNDFSSSNPNNIYAFAVGAGDINYQAQQFTAVPVPAAAWLMGSGLVGLAGLARRKK
jgi:hypothetical protein